MTTIDDGDDNGNADERSGGIKQSSSSSQPDGKRHRRGGKPSQPVEQYDLATGRTIAQFDCQGDGARAFSIDPSTISACVSGRLLQAGGFGWRKQEPGGGAAGAGAANKSEAAGAATPCQQEGKKRKVDKISPPSSSPVPSRQPNVDPPHGSHEGRPVEQYDRATGRMIAQFESQSDAERATGIAQGGISACIRGKATHAGDYGWRTPGTGVGTNYKPPKASSRSPKPVEQYDLATGRTVATFDSQADAARAASVDQSSISQCVHGKLTRVGGYGWRTIAAASDKGVTSEGPSTFSRQSAGNKSCCGGPHAKPVDQFDLTSGRTIGRFESLSDAERATGVPMTIISYFIGGESTEGGGFGWRRPGTGMGAAGEASDKHRSMSSSSSSSSSGSRMQGIGSGGGHNQAGLAVENEVEEDDEGEVGEVDAEQDEEGGELSDDGYGAYEGGNNDDVDQEDEEAVSSSCTGSISPWSLALALTSSMPSSRTGGTSAPVAPTVPVVARDDKNAVANDNDVDDVGSVGTLEDPCGIAARAISTAAFALVTPALHTHPNQSLSTPASSTSSTSSSSASSTSSSSNTASPASLLPTITQQQRQQLRDAIFNHLCQSELANPICDSMMTAEELEKAEELRVRATVIEEDLYQQYDTDAYLQLFDPESLLIALTCYN